MKFGPGKGKYVLLHLCLLLILVFLLSVSAVKELKRNGKNVCTFYQSKTTYATLKTKVSTVRTKEVCCSKWLFCWKKCKRSRVSTKTVTRTVSRLKKDRVLHCCQGYTVDSSGTECSTPICNPHCRNGGACIGPNRCSCKHGFEGRFCQLDINECLSSNHGCSQRCINLPGTYSCLCERGFIPGDPESKTCKDIDECKGLRDSKGRHSNPCRCYGDECGNVCRNTIGSYRCRCGKGYKISVWNICVDRNECIEDPDICPQKCINTPGSFKCHCWNGFRWNEESRKCEEINECSIGNGGCEHACINVYGGHVCSCRDGFYLADDRTSCIDFNECEGATECDSRTSTCINTPGDYYCQCRAGFIFSKKDGICVDIDECEQSTALCNQRCQNTFGSYRCGCDVGFYMSRDKITCKDINECSRGRCGQICMNTLGSFKCFCKEGYMLDVDGKTCRPKLCEVIEAPFFGEIDCNGYIVDRICRFTCHEGYHLDMDAARRCLPSGKWSNRQPSCIPNACQVPRPPAYGKLLLPCDQSYGSTCPVSCSRGYVLRGPNLLKCEMYGGKVNWDLHRVRCEEIRVCKPNPCQFEGECRIVTPTRYACNCSGTGHKGKNCEIGFVTIPRFPKMLVNKRTYVTITANPSKYVETKIFPEDAFITVRPASLVIRRGGKTSRFSIVSNEGGIKSVSYEVVSQEPYATPGPSLILFYKQTDLLGSRVASLSQLVSGCYEVVMQQLLDCPAVRIESSSPWSKNSDGNPLTDGLAVINIGKAKFPLAFPGVYVAEIFSDSSKLLEYRINARKSSCHSPTLTPGQMQYIAEKDIFANEFLRQFSSLMPGWFNIETIEKLSLFSADNVRTFVWNGNKVSEHELCSSLAINRAGNFLVYIHHENLALKVHDKVSRIQTSKAFCLAVDICRLESHLQIPDEFTADLISMLSFQELSSLGWKLSVKSVGFATTSADDSRKCLTKQPRNGERKIVFGDANIEYVNKNGVKAMATGDLVLGFRKENGKEIIDLSSSCIDGNSLIETPTWKATDMNEDIYHRSTKTNVINLVKGPTSNRHSVLSLIQKGGSVFKIKSGIRPVIRKSSRDIKLSLKYEQTEESSAALGDSNFDKYNNLEMLSFTLIDLEAALETLVASGSIAGHLSELKNKVTSWSTKLQADLELVCMNIEDTGLINAKVRANFYKAKDIDSKIRQFLSIGSSSIKDSVDGIQKAQNDMNVVLDELETAVKSVTASKKFHSLNLNFNSSMCLFKPCIPDVAVKIYPQSTDVTKQGFCFDPSKTPFQMWDTEAVVAAHKKIGNFFTFSDRDKFHLCLSVYGVSKGKFTGTLHMLGNILKSEFLYRKPSISIPATNYKLFGKYGFDVNGTVDATLNKWNMLSVKLDGKAEEGSEFLRNMQENMDQISIRYFYELRSKKRAVNKRLGDLEKETGYLRSKLHNDQQILRNNARRYAKAKAKLLKHRVIFNKQKAEFQRYRFEFRSLSRNLNRICPLKKCPLRCIKIKECKVCQGKLYGKKTVPKCRTDFQQRSYAYKDSYKGQCSHIVQDRKLKYTGNCKEPELEQNSRNRILAELKRKQENNQPLTIEDALNLELVDKKSGQELLKAIRRRNFFKTFPKRLEKGILTEADLGKLKKYTNSSFAVKIRKHLKNIKLQILLKELTVKTQNGGELTEEDYKRVKKLDPEVGKKLESNELLQNVVEKIRKGKALSDADLQVLKAENPEYYQNFTKAREQKKVLKGIEKKLQSGKITNADINELAKINPEAAKNLKDALKEQLMKKVDEMKKKMESVKDTLDAGSGERSLSSITDKISKLNKNRRPLNREGLKRLQDKIKKALATKGTVFQEVLERFDLSLEIQNVTGSSSDMQRTLNSFFSSLRRFNLPNIFQQSQNLMSEQLLDLQRWFETAAKFMEMLCSKCGKNCDKENALKKALDEMTNSIGEFVRELCQFQRQKRLGVNTLKETCRIVNEVKTFSQTYIVRKTRDCKEIRAKLVTKLNLIAESWKNLRNSDTGLFEKIWKGSAVTSSALGAYGCIFRSLNSVVKSISNDIKLPLPDKDEIRTRVSRILRPGTFNIKNVEYIVSRTAITAIHDVIKKLPVDSKVKANQDINISKKTVSFASQKFRTLLATLTTTLPNVCPSSKNVEFKQTEDRLKSILNFVGTEFNNMLNAKKLEAFFSSSQRLTSALEHCLKMAAEIVAKKLKCVPEYEKPLAKLSSFLNNVQNLDVKNYKDIARTIESKLKEVGNGIKAPIGKLLDNFEKIVINTPAFDLPLMLTLKPDYFKLSISGLEDYFDIMSQTFSALVSISKKCKNCKLEEVFGKYNLKAITEKLDNKLKPFSKKIYRFIEDVKFSMKGAPLLFSSLEQIRTNLQRVYDSETGLNRESLREIADTFKTAKEAAELIKEGQFEFVLKFAGAKNKEIFTIVKELDAIRKQVYDLYQKSEGSEKELEILHRGIKATLLKIPSVSESISSLKEGAIERRLATIKNIAKTVKDLVTKIPKLYRQLRGQSLKYFRDNFIPAVGKHLDSIEETKAQLFSKTQIFLEHVGVFKAGQDLGIKGIIKANRIQQRKYSQLFKQFLSARSNQAYVTREMGRKVKVDQRIISRFTNAWDNLYEKITGKVDMIKAKVTKLREKFSKYAVIYEDVRNTVEEMKKGPISEIGKIKDSLGEFSDSFDEYDFRKMMTSDPGVLRRKLSEMKELFRLSGETLRKTDSIIRKCRSCNVGNTLGYKFIKNLAGKFEKKLSMYYDYLNEFAGRFSSSLKEAQSITKAVGRLRDRFRNVHHGKQFGSEMLKDLSDALSWSKGDIDVLQSSAKELTSILIGQDVDLQVLRASYNGLVDQLQQAFKKSAIIAKNVESVYKQAKDLGKKLDRLDSQASMLENGPLETRVAIARDISKGVKTLMSSLPMILSSSKSTLKSAGIDTAWVTRFSSGLSKVTEKLDKVLSKTDAVLDASGVVIAGKKSMSNQFSAIKGVFKDMNEAPWDKKLGLARNLARKTGSLMDTALDTAVRTANALNVDLKKEDLLSSIQSVVGQKRLAKFKDISHTVINTVEKLQHGPISKIGKLTDSLEDFVDGLEGFDVGKAMLSDPASLKEKIAEFQQLADGTADILVSVSDITGDCWDCKIDKILGKGFMKGISDKIAHTFSSLHEKVASIGKRAKLGYSGWKQFVSRTESISKSFNNIIKSGKIDANTFQTAANELRNTAKNLQEMKTSSSSIFKAIFQNDNDMTKAQRKFEGIVENISKVMNKATRLSDDVEITFNSVDRIKGTFSSISNNFDQIQKGPIDVRIDATREMVKGVKSILNVVPRLINESAKVGSHLGINSRWLQSFSNDVVGFNNDINSVFEKTDSVLKQTGIATKGLRNISDTSTLLVNDFKEVLHAPWKDKFKKMDDLIIKTDSIFNSAIKTSAAVEATLNTVLNTNINMTSGLSRITDSVSGFMQNISRGIKHVEGIYDDVKATVDALKSGPVSKVGALTDSITDFVKLMKNYNLAEVLVLSPKFAAEKFREAKDIIKDSGVILKNISSLVSRVCPRCNINELFGNKFLKDIKDGFTTGFDRLVGNATRFLNKVGQGAEGVVDIVNSVHGIEDQFRKLKGIKFDSEGINTVSDILQSSSGLVGAIGGNSSKIFSALFDKNKDMLMLKGKFEGLVTNVASFIGNAGKITSKVGDAFKKVEEVKDSFKSIETSFKNIGEGPLEARVDAAKNIINGVMTITSGLPELFNSASLGLKSTAFLRRFGTQLQDVTSGINRVLNTTNGFITDVGNTIGGIKNIGKISSEIGSNFQKILRAPTAQKFKLVQKTISQIKDLTVEVNKFTGGVSKAVEKITGKTMLSTSIFGNSTENVLSDISNAVGLVADRYDKFQALTDTFSKAFKDISSDPIKFALNDLPKLFTQTESFIKLIVSDTKGIADRLGIKLDKINLDPALVPTAKEFYGFAKGALGTFQSGQKLFTDFKTLFNSKDFVSGMENLQRLTATGKTFIKDLDGLGETLFKGKWKNIRGKFDKMVGKIGDSVGINLEKAAELFSKGMKVAGAGFGIYSDIKTLINIKEFNAETVLKGAQAIIGIAEKTTVILNTFGANIQTKALESLSSKVGTAVAVFQIAKGIYDFVGWVNDVCDITYETNVVNKEFQYACLKTRLKVDTTKIPIDDCKYETTDVRRGYASANFCCDGTKCVYLQRSSCLKASERCLENRLNYVKSSSRINSNLAEAYSDFETADQAMTAAQLDMKAAESLKKRYQIAYNQSIALYRVSRLNKARARKNRDSIARAMSLIKRFVNRHANTSTIRFTKAEFRITLYSPNQQMIPLTVSYQDPSGLSKEFSFIFDFGNVKESLERTLKTMVARLTEYSIFRKRRSVDAGKSATKVAPLRCSELKDNTELFVDVLKSLELGLKSISTGRSYANLRRTKGIRISKKPSEARRQLIKEIMLLSSSLYTTAKDVVNAWKVDTATKLSKVKEGECSGFEDCMVTMRENMQELFHAGLKGYKESISTINELVDNILKIPVGSVYKSTVEAIVRRSLQLTARLSVSASVCDNAPKFTSRSPSSILAYVGEDLQIECLVAADSTVQYQWYVNDTIIPGSESRFLTISDASNDDEGSYYCQVSNAAGVVNSDAVFVKVSTRLAFVEELQDIAIPIDNPSSMTLACNVTVNDDVTYSWWKQSFSGRASRLRQKTALLNLGRGSARKNGIYWCEVSNGYARIRSRKATVAVVRSVQRRHSVRMEIDIESDAGNPDRCRDLSVEKVSAFKNHLNSHFVKYFDISNTRTRVFIDVKLDEHKHYGRLVVMVSLTTLIQVRGSDEDLAAHDAKTQDEAKKAVNEFESGFVDGQKKLRFDGCVYSLMEKNKNVSSNVAGYSCPAGMGLSENNLRCLACLPGNFENGMRRCRKCPQGSYQPRFGKSTCLPCGNGQLTETFGNVDASFCSKTDFKCMDKLKVIIALDTSNQVHQRDFNKMKTFVKHLVGEFDVKPNAASISVATFDDVAKLKVVFDAYDSVTGLQAAISKLRRAGTSRRTDLLLELAADVFNEDDGKNTRKVLIVIANGPVASTGSLELEAKVKILKNAGVEIFYTGTGRSLSSDEAIVISSSPKEDHVFKMADSLQLAKASTMIANSVCNSDQP